MSKKGIKVDRRRFLQLMGAAWALGGTACTRQPLEKIVPYAKRPEDIVPGVPLFFMTSFPFGGYAQPLMVETHEGRPTKIEGNPIHPASKGATTLFAQASILDLYDPDRTKTFFRNNTIRTRKTFENYVNGKLETLRDGRGIWVITPFASSNSLKWLWGKVLERFPGARWVTYEPFSRFYIFKGLHEVSGVWGDVYYDLSTVDLLVTLDADPLAGFPGSTSYARAFGEKRRVYESEKLMRIYSVERTFTPTGSVADHRLSLAPSQIINFTLALANRLGLGSDAQFPEGTEKFGETLVNDLLRNKGRSLIVAGEHLPYQLHALVFAINAFLDNLNSTIFFTSPILANTEKNPFEAIGEFSKALSNNEVKLVIFYDTNPVYYSPSEFDLFNQLRVSKATKIHFGLLKDETAFACDWHVPALHYLECWGDHKAYDGTLSMQQPMIEPLYNGFSLHEVFGMLAGLKGDSYDLVKEYWQNDYGLSESEWKQFVHDGFLPRKGEDLDLKVDIGKGVGLAQSLSRKESAIEIVLAPDPTVYDGRFANNSWLQECPKFATKVVWDNPALLSPKTARQLRVKSGDYVELDVDGRTLRLPVWVLEGHADGAISIFAGYGRKAGGDIAKDKGFYCYKFMTTAMPYVYYGEARKGGSDRYELVSTQGHHRMEGRHIVRYATLEEYEANHHFARELEEEPSEDMSLYPPFEYNGNAWAMVIDLSLCIGCNACIIACQSENNVPVVGKEEVAVGREMHWLRVDGYFEGDKLLHQPVPCMQCENAPCEVVCPVTATVHSKEGLNDMVYNRCVGTRYCQNNCPYKVRRFNFYLYQDWYTETLKMLRNPNVSVRSRGVMEKCTYCIQRISKARIAASVEGRDIQPGEIVTACQQACPTQAIYFGDKNNQNDRIYKLYNEPLTYSLLASLNTRPRTRYVARVINANSELVQREVKKEGNTHG